MFNDPFYSISDLTRLLKVSRATLYRRVQDGTLPPIDPILKRFRGSELQSWYESGKAWATVQAEEKLHLV